MEIKYTILYRLPFVRLGMLCIVFWCTVLQAQDKVKLYTIKDGKMYIELSVQLPQASLDSFIAKYNLQDLGLKQLISSAIPDSLKKAGWNVQTNNSAYVLTKPFFGFDEFNHPGEKIISLEGPSFGVLFPPVSSETKFGSNRFKNKFPFAVNNGVVTFYLRNHTKAQRVMLAGSFTQWGSNPVAMTRTDSGWIAQIKLEPGKYWYKFIIDGNWQTDIDNLLRENDGQGNINSVYFKTNFLFTTPLFNGAKRVYLAGSFNGWKPRDLLMDKTASGWQLPLYLADGTHTYKFVVDGNWVNDEKNPKRLPDEFGGQNNYIEIGTPHLFTLPGFTNARQVILAGTFNNWHEHELRMIKTDSGWHLPYTLGKGNYEYKFIVDGKWMTDPANPVMVNNTAGSQNSYLIIGANYTFCLKDMPDAKNVFIAGDFNSWSPNGLRMQRDGNDWIFKLHLRPGKHRYKFIADGEWMIDPGNKLWEQNEYNTRNSIIWVEETGE